MSDIRVHLIREGIMPFECSFRLYDGEDCLGTARFLFADLRELIATEPDDKRVVAQILKILPPRKAIGRHSIGCDGTCLVELRGNCWRIFIEKDASVSVRHGWIDIHAIIEFLWGPNFSECIPWR